MKSMRILMVVASLCFSAVVSGQIGIIATVAGNGVSDFAGDGGPATSASLTNPGQVAVDAAGNYFIADSGNHRVRRVSVDGVIMTAAGGGMTLGDGGRATSAMLMSPSGIALDRSGNLFIADSFAARVRKVSSDGTITTLAGNGTQGFSGDGGAASSASLNYPSGVAVDGGGNVFIADQGNSRIRRVSTAGTITTVAGNGRGGFSGDGGSATAASLGYPSSVAIDGSGNILIADTSNSRIRKVQAGIITTIAGREKDGFSGDGGLATSARLSYPLAVTTDSAGNVFIADSSNSRIRKVSTSGIITTVAGKGSWGFSGDLGPATSALLNSPSGIVVDPAGNLFIADGYSNRVREVSASIPALAATFSVDPANIDFSLGPGDSDSRRLQIGGARGVSWQAIATTSTGGTWLKVAPAAGETPASLSVQLDASSLTSGIYRGSISIRAPGAIPPSITINVSLYVYGTATYAYRISNAASGQVSEENGHGIAQGSLFLVDGERLGTGRVGSDQVADFLLQQAGSFPIPANRGGTSIQIMVNGQSYDAPIVYASYAQVAAILPSATPVGTARSWSLTTARQQMPFPFMW